MSIRAPSHARSRPNLSFPLRAFTTSRRCTGIEWGRDSHACAPHRAPRSTSHNRHRMRAACALKFAFNDSQNEAIYREPRSIRTAQPLHWEAVFRFAAVVLVPVMLSLSGCARDPVQRGTNLYADGHYIEAAEVFERTE